MTREELEIIGKIQDNIEKIKISSELTMQSVTYLEAHVEAQNGRVRKLEDDINKIKPSCYENNQKIDSLLKETDSVRFWYRNPTLAKTYNLGKIIILLGVLASIILGIHNFVEKTTTTSNKIEKIEKK
ncbi:MAG: hypothetical protein GF317_23445 [Candidatus Lokiarchaeota archaeon]|nr:hypothetical protein [Candidatus Lokiarchaeota archaeon]